MVDQEQFSLMKIFQKWEKFSSKWQKFFNKVMKSSYKSLQDELAAKNIRIQWYTRKMSSHLKKCNKENNEELCFCEIPHILKYYVYGMYVYTYLHICSLKTDNSLFSRTQNFWVCMVSNLYLKLSNYFHSFLLYLHLDVVTTN